MVAVDIVRTVLAVSIFVCSFWTKPTITFLCILVLLVIFLETVGTLSGPAATAFLPKMVGSKDLSTAIRYTQASTSTASLVGFVFGGALISILGAQILFLLDGMSFVMSVLSLFSLKTKEPRQLKTVTSSFIAEWRAGLTTMLRTKSILRVSLMAVTANFALSSMNIVLTAWVKGPLNGTGWMLGSISGCTMTGVIIGSLTVGQLRKVLGNRQILLVAGLVLGICDGSIGMFPHVFVDASLSVIAGLGVGCLNTTIGLMILEVTPRDKLGRVSATPRTVATLSAPLGKQHLVL